MLKAFAPIIVKNYEELFDELFTEVMDGTPYPKSVAYARNHINEFNNEYISVQLRKCIRNSSPITRFKPTYVRIHKEVLKERPERAVLTQFLGETAQGKKAQFIQLQPDKLDKPKKQYATLVIQKSFKNPYALCVLGVMDDNPDQAATITTITLVNRDCEPNDDQIIHILNSYL